ncbi:hypothetical protein [Hymenobacter cellulosivorans]|uniref:PRC-barrel domain containing protein n=1 Tax=Hymenobacter cellulosivorans TaxID=2932249 RepID=A0ABY4FA29_9BACT|nr:hypothetical protein [Hymenobacter cellulosivorans]UOQ53528.1 hypothetical protein MUN80_01930 [Hymenobacter cellulosivorans]
MTPAPKLTEQQARAIAEQGLRLRNISYDEKTGLRARFDGLSTEVLGRKGEEIMLWTVSYLTAPNSFGFDQEMFFVDIDDSTAEILYIIGPREYIE